MVWILIWPYLSIRSDVFKSALLETKLFPKSQFSKRKFFFPSSRLKPSSLLQRSIPTAWFCHQKASCWELVHFPFMSGVWLTANTLSSEMVKNLISSSDMISGKICRYRAVPQAYSCRLFTTSQWTLPSLFSDKCSMAQGELAYTPLD